MSSKIKPLGNMLLFVSILTFIHFPSSLINVFLFSYHYNQSFVGIPANSLLSKFILLL